MLKFKSLILLLAGISGALSCMAQNIPQSAHPDTNTADTFKRSNIYSDAMHLCTLQHLSDREAEVYIARKKMEFLAAPGKQSGAVIQPSRPQKPARVAGLVNPDFETGDFSGWVGAYGYNANSVKPLTVASNAILTLGKNASEKSCSFHTLVGTTIPTDPYGNFRPLDAGGGSWAVRLGGEHINMNYSVDKSCNLTSPNSSASNGEYLQQTFTVTSATALFNFNFAMIMSSSSHLHGNNPYIRIEVLKQNGDTIPGMKYYYEEGDYGLIPSGFLTSPLRDSLANPVYYSNWNTGSFNLSPYIGTNVTVRFTCAGCTWGGHFATLYLDCYSSPLQIAASSQYVCKGGTVTLTAPAAGLASTAYQWQTLPSGTAGIVGSTGNRTAVINAPGSYRVTITPAGNPALTYHLDTLVHFLNAQSPSVSFARTTVSCTPGNDGTATAAVTGGTGPYSYTWSPLPGGGQGTATATGLRVATYTLSYSDAQGCGNDSAVSILLPPPLSATVSSMPAQCDSSNGTAQAIVSGGTGSYTYSWSSVPVQTGSIAHLPAGFYEVLIQDFKACFVRDSIIVASTKPPVLNLRTTPLSCNGTCDGTATVTASGGAFPYSYTWTPGGTTNHLSALCAGTYVCKVKDAAGCVATTYVRISQPGKTVLTVTSQNLSCNSSQLGSASVSVSASLKPYSYSWTPGVCMAPNYTNLVAGYYTCTVIDSAGCSTAAVAAVDNPPHLYITGTVSSPLCNQKNGSISASINGASGVYTYSWAPPVSSSLTAVNLAAGSYTLTVTDSIGCQTNQAFMVSNTMGPAFSLRVGAPTCHGKCDASVHASVSSGTPPYTYSWCGYPSTGDSLSQICPAMYTCMVSDKNGCSTLNSVSVGDPIPITMTFLNTPASCSRCDGALQVASTTSALAPVTYSWSPSPGNQTQISNLCPGWYTCTLSDKNACTASFSVKLGINPSLVLSTTSQKALCSGFCNGQASVVANGGAGTLSYTWSPQAGNGSSIAKLCPGVYTCVVSDTTHCSASISVVIDSSSTLQALSTNYDVSCYGGTDGKCLAMGTGGFTPYTYSWSPGTCAAATYPHLLPGTYTCTVTDSTGCKAQTQRTVAQPLPLSLHFVNTPAGCASCATGQVKAVAGGGNAYKYNYSWTSSGCIIDSCMQLLPGIYTCCVKDYFGCSLCASDTLSFMTGIANLSSETLFSVSPNPFSDIISLEIERGGTGVLKICTIEGKILFNKSVSGERLEISGRLFPAGVYLVTYTTERVSVCRKLVKY